jgi:hypothetical protein
MLQQWLAKFSRLSRLEDKFLPYHYKKTVALSLLPQVSMLSGAELYCGYTIHWELISSGDGPWNAKASIVSAPDSSGFRKIISITASRFESEAEARDYVVRAARTQIDEMVRVTK